MKLVGRERESQVLEGLCSSKDPHFLALYGRRRVGKTYLIRNFFKDKGGIFFNVTGSKGGKLNEQTQHFIDQVGKVFYKGAQLQLEKTWDSCFSVLTKAINEFANTEKRVILFFDELPWMATRNSRLLEALDYYWNQHWSNDARILLIICGSSASWIINNIINNRGGLHNRVTKQIHLEPFDLQNTRKFLESRDIHLNNNQIAEIFMTTGGIPYYLSHLEKNLSVSQNIEQLAFSKNAFFLREFDNLFASLFDDPEEYIDIIKIIADNRYGIGERKLLEKLGKRLIGAVGKKRLKNLENSGFIMRFKPLFHKKRGTYYRLVDEYCLFYLKWILPVADSLHHHALSEGSWQAIQETTEWKTWQGYAFETLCYKHLANIRQALHLLPTATPGTWQYVPKSGSQEQGAQVDLLFDRKDDAITLVEIKFSRQAFSITKEYAGKLKHKIDVFKNKTGTSKQVFLAIVSANGLQNNLYSQDLISGIVTLEDFF